jgi:hypothetical protein
MASAELSRRVERVVGYPPLSEMSERQRREFQEALLDADSEDLPGKWQAAVLEAEQHRPAAAGRDQRIARGGAGHHRRGEALLWRLPTGR